EQRETRPPQFGEVQSDGGRPPPPYFLVGELGVGYLKLDYNINGGVGTDTGGLSPGAGLLAHNRAHLDWLDSVLDRYPGLTLENCASGGLRTDYAMLSRLHLQSTSDQQDFLRYPAIAAAAPSIMAPEQAANWAYPQPTSPTTRSPSPCAAPCSAGSTCPDT
ncbi:MAG TPA: hypothetical protein VGL06_26915, partial [Pseudonocardiaceae bacterium]